MGSLEDKVAAGAKSLKEAQEDLAHKDKLVGHDSTSMQKKVDELNAKIGKM